MLTPIFIVSLVLWFLGIMADSIFGGFIHILLLVALVTAFIRSTQRRQTRVVIARARMPDTVCCQSHFPVDVTARVKKETDDLEAMRQANLKSFRP